MEKIIRSICIFSDKVESNHYENLLELKKLHEKYDYQIQTLRICFESKNLDKIHKHYSTKKDILLSIGSLNDSELNDCFNDLMNFDGLSFNLDLSNNEITLAHVDILYKILENHPERLFNFTYSFNNTKGSPYFPSASYLNNGYALGLQSTNLSALSNNLTDWLANMSNIWGELIQINTDQSFQGIDSSIAPLNNNDGSLINLLKRLYGTFDDIVVSNIFTNITNFIKSQNPKPVGLCGLMLPCLEDFELASEYEQGHFNIERNIFLSLHSGLGIDTYPIGVDQKRTRVLDILKCLQALSSKYNKPLSCRFISDGKTKIGSKSNFNNIYLKDVIINKL